ncbi:hypothetical protein M422DRAFT_32036 [Sphaerobolus stellatus SS14]|uniref:Uncharacterized protein n=1 Tax=Sphaerobolus stellatus (strain SS14) TaxID=990650 RepID=A0A0C9UCW0_SPHS4|nr:hypothetical protein M422DRAFT_32036 [Sphaerobolus stellatus SS14]
MPKPILELKPSRKVTEFFQPKPKTKTPESQRAGSTSSPLERQSGSSESFKGTTGNSKLSKSKGSASATAKKSLPTQTSNQDASAVASAIQSSRSLNLASRPKRTDAGNSTKASIKPPNAVTPKPPLSPTKPSRKRKEVISSEESDSADPVFPVIRVDKTLSRRGTPQPSIAQATLQKSTMPVTPNPKVNQPSTKSPKHRPSPPKRPRLDSPKKAIQPGQGFDADDESDDKDPKPVEGSVEANLPMLKNMSIESSNDSPMDVDMVTPTTTLGASDFDSTIKPPVVQASAIDTSEILPSSQQGEMLPELDLDVEMAASDKEEIAVPLPPPPTVVNEMSPTKARTYAIIADIRRKAEEQAASALAETNKRTSLGLLSDDSDLSSVSSLGESDDDNTSDLDLNLAQLLKKPSPAKSTLPAGTRRSARTVHQYRDVSPSPASRVIPKPKPKPKAADPLLALLKEAKRDATRKAQVEKKRVKFEETSDPAMECEGVSPARLSRGDDDSDSESMGDGSSFDVSMTVETREELLGKESSEAVGKILEKDKKKGRENQGPLFFFWREPTEVVEDVLPAFPVLAQSNTFLAAFHQVLSRQDYTVCSVLLDSGALAHVPLSAALTSWLFANALSTTEPKFSRSAYHSFLNAHRYSSGNSLPKLSADAILGPLLKLGVQPAVLEALNMSANNVVRVDADLKAGLLSRYANMLQAMGSAQAIELDAVPQVVSTLALLGLDRFTTAELRQEIVNAIESIIAGCASNANVELALCKQIYKVATASIVPVCQRPRVLSFVSGGAPAAARIRRWTAWSLLGGNIDGPEAAWGDYPPLDVSENLFDKTEPGTVKFIVDKDTDYELLGALVDTLSVALTDVETQVKKDKATAAFLERICKSLERLMGKIVDTRAAHLERTFAKDSMNRLHKRLVYQRDAALKSMRTKTGKMDQYLIRKQNAIAKPVAVVSTKA